MYIGIDVHKDSCYLTAMDAKGEVLWEKEVGTRDKEWIKELENGSRIAMEAGTYSKPLYNELKSRGFDVLMAHPRKLRMIAESSKKTDRNDSFHLANLLRMEYLPCSYVPEEHYEEIRNLCRRRETLGHKIARVKNEVHALIGRNGIELEYSDIFGAAGLEELKSLKLGDMDSYLLASCLKELEFLSEEASEIQQKIAFFAERSKEAKLLMTVPGIDYYSAMMIIGEIGDVTRFPDDKRLTSYAGFVARQRDTGKTKKRGGISKEGSKHLRWILVQVVHSLLRCRKGNNTLKGFYAHLRRRGKCEKVAVVATARKLLCIIYAMLTKGEEYKEGNDLLTQRKMQRMKKVSLPVVPADVAGSVDRLKRKVDILGGGYAVK